MIAVQISYQKLHNILCKKHFQKKGQRNEYKFSGRYSQCTWAAGYRIGETPEVFCNLLLKLGSSVTGQNYLGVRMDRKAYFN
jgi:hypothetical protein